MNLKKIAIVECEDWVGLYLDGELFWENHSLSGARLLSLLGIAFETFEGDCAINEEGRLPHDLSDVRDAVAAEEATRKELAVAERRVEELKRQLKTT